MIFLTKNWSELTLNSKINYRGTCIPVYNNDSIDWTNNLPANGQSIGCLKISQYYEEIHDVDFSKDVDFIADAIVENNEEILFFEKDRMSRNWYQYEPLENEDIYFSMVLLPVSRIWAYAPIVIEAQKVATVLVENETIKSRLLFDRI